MEGARNTLIVELSGHSNQTYYQGFNNDALVVKGAIVVFLMRAGIRDRSQLKLMSDKQHRDAVINFIHSYTDEPLATLQSLSDGELVRWGFAIKGDTVTAMTARRAGA